MRARLRGVAAAFAGCALLACGEPESPALPGQAGEAQPARSALGPAPEFELDRLGGGEVSLASLRGQPVVLDFWATWCAPCIESVPVLNAFQEAQRAAGVAVFGISIDVEGEEVVGPWVAKYDVRYPVLLAQPDLAQRYGALGLPATFFIAPDGTIIERHMGELTTLDLERGLERVQSYWSDARRFQ